MEKPSTYGVKGMHCASCASVIEGELKKVDGVEMAEVNFATEKAKLKFDHGKTNIKKLSERIEHLGYELVDEKNSMGMSAREMGMSEDEHKAHLGLGQSKKEKLQELSNLKRIVISLIPMAIISIFVMTWETFAKFGALTEIPEIWMEFFHHLLPVLATYTLFVAGKPYLLGLWRFLKYRKANMDTLIGLGTLTAYIYSFTITAFEETLRPFLNVEENYYDVVIVVIAFITLGKYLESRSKIKTGDAIEKLLNLQAKTALVLREGKEMEIPVAEVLHGDMIVVKPGGSIPVDGVVAQGESYVDESMVSGESMPVSKKIGDTVVAGTINTSGSFVFKATKVGSETLLSKIIKMVEEAQGSRAPIQALADKISSVFVPVVLVISFLALGAWLIIGSQYLDFSQALSFGLLSFVGVLVIACPCALGLATPTAIIVGVGKGAREGILVKDAGTLEKLHKASVVLVDKTGTLTYGKPELISTKNSSKIPDDDLLSILASLETKSEHPIAHAIVQSAKEKSLKIEEVTKFESIKGKGLVGIVNENEYFVGNSKFIEEKGYNFDHEWVTVETMQGRTPVFIADRDNLLGIFMVADKIKPESVEAVKNLKKLGIKVIMLTGDNKNTADFIAKEAGVDEVVSEVLPQDKLEKIKGLQAKGEVVIMAGDGINDAPALAQADVGVAMATGTDVAIESAGITLLHGDISKLVKAIKLSKITMRGIRQNLFWAFIYNVLGIPLAGGLFYPFLGIMLSPIFAGFAMAMSSVSVVGNSLRLKAKKI